MEPSKRIRVSTVFTIAYCSNGISARLSMDKVEHAVSMVKNVLAQITAHLITLVVQRTCNISHVQPTSKHVVWTHSTFQTIMAQ